jgi:hypothetical protein
MAFADGNYYNVLDMGVPVQITLKSTAGTVQAGRLIGYSGGWVLADDSTGVAAKYVALTSGVGGEQINVAQEAVVAGVTGGTAGALVYLDESGGYDDAAGGVLAQPVGRHLTATTMAINLANYEPANLPVSLFDAVTDTYVPVSTGSALVAVAVSSDATLANTGELTVGAGKITIAKMTATAKKQYVRTLTPFNIDAGAGTTVDEVLLVPKEDIEITDLKVVYTDATSGACAAATVSVGTSAVTGVEIAAAQNLVEGKTVGSTQALTIAEGTVAAGATIYVRWTGVAATVAGKVFLQAEYNVID